MPTLRLVEAFCFLVTGVAPHNEPRGHVADAAAVHVLDVVTLCPLASALVFKGALNSSTPGQLELAAKPGTCLVASGNGEDPCDGHGCIVEAPCSNGEPEACSSALCEWKTAPAPGGDGVLVQMIDRRGYPVCLDYNEQVERVQAFDCCSTTGHVNRSVSQDWFFSASSTTSGFTIKTTMANHSGSANICARTTSEAMKDAWHTAIPVGTPGSGEVSDGPDGTGNACSEQLKSDGCLGPEISAAQCDECAGAHRSSLGKAGCTTEEVELLCQNSPPSPPPTPTAGDAKLILLNSTPGHGGLCLDGSPAGFYYEPSTSKNASDTWMIYLLAGWRGLLHARGLRRAIKTGTRQLHQMATDAFQRLPQLRERADGAGLC